MALNYTNAVWKRSATKGLHRLVLLALADCASREGYAFPSLNTLAKMTRSSKRSVRRALDQMTPDRLDDGRRIGPELIEQPPKRVQGGFVHAWQIRLTTDKEQEEIDADE